MTKVSSLDFWPEYALSSQHLCLFTKSVLNSTFSISELSCENIFDDIEKIWTKQIWIEQNDFAKLKEYISHIILVVIVHMCFKKSQCNFYKILLSESQENDANNFIAALNWSGLIFPSEIIVNAVSYVFVVKLSNFVKKSFSNYKIRENLLTSLNLDILFSESSRTIFVTMGMIWEML